MRKIYFLSSCSTCQRIMNDLGIDALWEQQDIKTEKITKKQLSEMKKRAGSFEALFSRRAMKYRSLGLNEMDLGEKDYEKWILNEYTFLKRPVMLINQDIFVGNSKKNVEAAKKALVAD